jgi:hypothetical protein
MGRERELPALFIFSARRRRPVPSIGPVIEKRFKSYDRVTYPIRIGGERAWPPEDCGLGTLDPNHINREHLWNKRW